MRFINRHAVTTELLERSVNAEVKGRMERDNYNTAQRKIKRGQKTGLFSEGTKRILAR
jgi:hypothetical protein